MAESVMTEEELLGALMQEGERLQQERAALPEPARAPALSSAPPQSEDPELDALIAQGEDLAARRAALDAPTMGERAGSAVQTGLTGLNILGGVPRTALADLLTTLGGKGEAVTGEDWKKAIAGQAPDFDEYLERAGVPRMEVFGDPDRPGSGYSLRKLGSFGVDMGMDLTNLLAPGAGLVAKAAKLGKAAPYVRGLGKAVGRPAGELSQWAGKKFFEKGLGKPAQALARQGKEGFPELAMEAGIRGTPRQMAAQADDVARGIEKVQRGLLRQANMAGKQVDMAPAMRQAERLAKVTAEQRPTLAPYVSDLLKEIEKYKEMGKVSVTHAHKLKSDLWDWMPQKAFVAGEQGTIDAGISRIKAKMAGGVRKGIQKAATEVSPKLASKIKDTDAKWGQFLSFRKLMQRETAGHVPLTRGETMGIARGLGVFGMPYHATGLATQATGAGLRNVASPWGFTYAGTAMQKLGKPNWGKIPGLLDPAMRRFAEQFRTPEEP